MKNIKISRNIVMLIISLLMCTFIYACTLKLYSFSSLGLGFYVSSIILSILYFVSKNVFDKLIDFIIKYRYLLALIALIVCVGLKIHGSSIGMFNKVVPTKKDESIKYTLFGEEKPIRSDEWQIMTPYNLSQKYNGFDVNSSLISLDGQNMIIGFNSAVKDLTVLGKPLVWGYILLGNEYGLSWYWVLKTILLIVFSFEIINILTKNKHLSLFGAFLITFAPSTQWWFAPHMPDVIIWFMVLFTMLYYLVSSEKTWLKNLLVVLTPFVVMQYVVALFPSFQVGLGYFMAAVFLAVMYRDKNKFYARKENIIRILLIGLGSVVLVGYFLYNNLSALKALNNTIYPGSRMILGGKNTVKDLFTNLGTPFLGYRGAILYKNQCEDSTYIHFGIFFLMLVPFIINALKNKKDRDFVVGITISIIMLIYASFMIFGFPAFLSKLTFFKYINRMNIIYGYISVIFTLWCINALSKVKDNLNKGCYYLALASFLIMNLSFIDDNLKAFMPTYYYYIEIALFGVILYCLYNDKFNKLFYSLLFGFLVFSSITINPIARGLEPINNHPSTDFIKEKIEEDSNSYWLGYNNFGFSSYLISIGAKTANAMNFYPDIKKWEIIDPEKKYEEIWNRYAYIITTFTNGDNHAANLMTKDVINLSINNETVYNLGVRYIMGCINDDLTIFNDKDYNYEEIYNDGSIRIFEIKKIENSKKGEEVKNGKEARKK